MAKILVVDDEQSQRDLLAGLLSKANHRVVVAGSGEEALKKIDEGIDLAIVDLKMPGMDGLTTLKEFKKLNPEICVIILTAYGTVETAVEAMKHGAYDYLNKPIDVDELLLIIKRAMEREELLTEVRYLKEELNRYAKIPEIIGESDAMKQVMSTAYRVAQTNATVLIRGESGTGKELLARAIHLASPRKERRFVPVSCAAIPSTLLESELFGYERGAFTDAIKTKKGKFEVADQGTLFLDEIGDMPLSTQVKLLRVLQEREVERLGSNVTIPVDVRVIAATNQNLEQKIKQGEFREDLYFRLNVVTIVIPPLRERREDIIPLALHFLKKYTSECKKPVEDITKEAKDVLLRYSWPGNIRELENAIERAVVLTRSNLIIPEDLPIIVKDTEKELPLRLDEVEKHHIERVLKLTNYNISQAASLLGIHRNTLREKIKKLNLQF
ncbi:MAG TPA: sigma-54-dependent Fis family transcriptional regulator [bacterium (Candidatus Stahlbacteria)]|nr:sigma-54-dependent Fis family transcriptional regulator [Candidatus Stahlbacteria bacterium]